MKMNDVLLEVYRAVKMSLQTKTVKLCEKEKCDYQIIRHPDRPTYKIMPADSEYRDYLVIKEGWHVVACAMYEGEEC